MCVHRCRCPSVRARRAGAGAWRGRRFVEELICTACSQSARLPSPESSEGEVKRTTGGMVHKRIGTSRTGVHSVKLGRHAAQIIRLWAWSPSSLPSGASAALSAARSPPRALSSRSSLCTYSWLGLGLGCPGRLLEPLHTQCTLQRKVRNRRALWSAIASTTQRAPANRGARTARGACGWTARPTPRCATP